jgi:hypothetical protein
MTDTDLLAPFDENVLRAVASENDIELSLLRDALADHQRTMRDNPGVEDLVYEWRKQYDDPVLARTDSVFVVSVPPGVWEQYGEYLDIETPTLQAVTAVHQEQTVRMDRISLGGMAPGHTALVVSRPD